MKPFLKVAGGNGYSEFVAVAGYVIQYPNNFVGCDSCEVMVYYGPLVNEICVAPGQTISEDGRGQWQGAITCANCTWLTYAAFKHSFGGTCLECGNPFGADHECSGDMLTEDEQRFRSNNFWDLRTKFLDMPRSVFGSQAIERMVVLD